MLFINVFITFAVEREFLILEIYLKLKNMRTTTSQFLRSHLYSHSVFTWGLSAMLFSLPATMVNTWGGEKTVISQAVQQNHNVTGKIIDENGEPMIGVSVLVKGTNVGAITDFDGNFKIKTPNGAKELQITYTGYKAQTVTITSDDLIIKMEPDNQLLDEVVVVGYGTQKKSDLTGSVGSLDTEKLVAKGAPSMMESLQGAVPGVQITQNSSRAGGGFNIQIRGKSSMNNDSGPLYVVDGVVTDNIQFLNPQDIERVDILKDASSTAIYGSRATEGVVMVTTKSAKSAKGKKPTISYDGYYGISKIARMPDFMNGIEFMQYRYSRFLTTENANVAQPTYRLIDTDHMKALVTNSDIVTEMLANGSGYNWRDFVTQNGQQQNHFLTVNGAGENISYHFGAGYQQQEGIFLKDNENRFNVKGAVDAKINDIFSAGISFNMANSYQDMGSSNAVSNAFLFNPYCIPFDANGEAYLQPGAKVALGTDGKGDTAFTSTISPIVDMENTTNKTRNWHVLGNLYLEAQPIKGLTLKTTFSPSYFHERTGLFENAQTQSLNNSGKETHAYIDQSEYFRWTWDNQINYQLTLGAHSFNAMGLFSMDSYNYEDSHMEAYNVTDGTTWYNMGTGTDDKTMTSNYTENSMISYALRLNYSYKGKYLFTGTVRWDGSSRFAPGHRWGSFPSLAVAWRLSEEEFLQRDWLSNLKLRLSFGVTGNNNVGDYATAVMPNTRYYYAFGSLRADGYGPSALANMSLSWEKTSEINLGLDFGFFNNRISGAIDLYNKESRDLLMSRNLPLEVGANPVITDNVGKVRNRGIEFALTTVNVETKDWHWDTSFTFAANKNEILEIDGKKEDNIGNEWFIGEPINVIYNYQWNGIVSDRNMTVPNNQAATDNGFQPGQSVKEADYYYKVYGWNEGMPIIEDIDGNGKITEDDKSILGHIDPSWTGSINTNLRYKNWDFSLSIYTKQNYMVQSPFMTTYLNYKDRGLSHYDFDYYIPAGTLILNDDGTEGIQENTHYGKYPFPNNSTTNQGTGSYFGNSSTSTRLYDIVDASYWKIKNISLGYTFPDKWIRKIGLSYLRLYANVTNPFVFTDYKGFDPEWADASLDQGGPSTITYQFGINLKF